MTSVRGSIETVKERIAAACVRGGRDPSGVRLVAVTKRVDRERILEALACGLTDFGENYVQEARDKIEGFPGKATWHMIGHVQTNKIKYIQRLFHVVHSVDRWEVAEGLDRYGKEIEILFELNLSREASKHGAAEDGLKRMMERCGELHHVTPAGLMTMAPYTDDPEEVRPVFRELREILERTNREFGLSMRELSMGMSSDFEVAIEEGATMVRIGTAIFGERP